MPAKKNSDLPLGLNRITLQLRYLNLKVDTSKLPKIAVSGSLPLCSGGSHAIKPNKDGTWRFSFDVNKYKDANGNLNKTPVQVYLAQILRGRKDVQVVSVRADPAFGDHQLFF